MKKRIGAIIAVGVLCIGAIVGSRIKVYDCFDLTLEQIQNRKGTILVECVTGEVIDADGGGKILNTPNGEEWFINYAGERGCKVGAVYRTYCVYNPFNNAEDDVVLRFDRKIK